MAAAAVPAGDDGSPADPPLGYEQARDELAEVVRRLETGSATLEESLALWERGEELARICQDWLDGARQRLAAATGRAAEPGSPAAAEGPPSPADGGSARTGG